MRKQNGYSLIELRLTAPSRAITRGANTGDSQQAVDRRVTPQHVIRGCDLLRYNDLRRRWEHM